MSLRHEDEFPILAPDQQAEAIRLALRLQEENRAGSSQALIEAAEEAGIERRFILEAVARVAARSAKFRSHNPSAGLALALMVAILSALWPFVPALPGAVLLGFAVSLLPTLRGSSRHTVAGIVVCAWLLLNLALWVVHIDIRREFTEGALIELAGTVVGIALAELVAATRITQGRPQPIP